MELHDTEEHTEEYVFFGYSDNTCKDQCNGHFGVFMKYVDKKNIEYL